MTISSLSGLFRPSVLAPSLVLAEGGYVGLPRDVSDCKGVFRSLETGVPMRVDSPVEGEGVSAPGWVLGNPKVVYDV
jgi:hypothetical protein